MEVAVAILGVLSLCLIAVIIKGALKRKRNHQILKQYGIPGPEPKFLDGNFYDLRQHPTPNDVISQWLKEFGNVFGYYVGGIPYVVVKDLDMLKQIMIKDFHVFENRPRLDIVMHPFDKSLIALEGQKWKDVRTLLTPTFSSGKIKLMTDIVNKKVDITVQQVQKRAQKGEMFDIYELLQGLTLDVIADCAFAMKTHCQENTKDPFVVSVRDFFLHSHNKVRELAIMFPFINPVLRILANYSTVGKMNTLIVGNVMKAINERQNNANIKSMDILQLLLDSKNGKAKEGSMRLTDEEIVGNAYIFLLGGYETTATALAFTFYLLITHTDVQERLRQEIDAVTDFSYSSIQSLQYLDQVFNEALRLYPPVIGFVSRACAEDHKVGEFMLPKGAQVLVPVWNIHHDPEIWTDPWKFDPDRFSPEKKGSINSMAFLSFGAGRRNCIGARFAQLEAKLAICRLLKNFKFEMCEKTDHPVELICPTVIITPANGIWLRAVPRD